MANNISEGEREVIKKEIKTTDTLYYKYLEAQYINLSSESARQKFKRDDNRKALLVNRNPKVNAKIYYIDDEAHKGWGMLFKEVIFKPFTQDSLFGYYDEFKKGEKRESLLARLKLKIKSLINDEGYNVFIIDLRLCDDDFHNGIDPCGFELIKEIKKINKGVQVVIFTASKKAENVNKALLAGVENYVLKESPENVLTREGSYQLYLEFYKKVTNAISKSYLASVHMTIEHLKSTTLFAGSTNDAQKLFRADTIGKDGSLDKIFSLVESRNDSFINYSVLTAFSTLEKFASLYFLPTSASGKIEKSDTSLFTVYTEAPNQKINTIFHFIRGRFSFQKSTANETINDVVFQAGHELHSKNDFEGPDKSSLTKIISVLKYRYYFDDIRLTKLIELRYLRSNLAAHNTGNVDESKRKIEIEDMSFLLDILKDVF
ncbi:response regulator [Mucilaginibacter antarcticus]